MPNYWLSITSAKNLDIDIGGEVGFDGYSERFRNAASRIEVGDYIVVYVTGYSSFWAINEVIGPMYEEHTAVWQDPRSGNEQYPLRFQIRRIIALPREKLLSVKPLVPDLDFIPEALKPARYGAAFRGSLRSISADDFHLIKGQMEERLFESKIPSETSGRTGGFVTAKKRFFGPPLNFRNLKHEPINEQGVVHLFGMVAHELGFLVEAIATEFPDCDAKRRIPSGPRAGQYEALKIEFEYRASNFRLHGHDPNICDLIVCWENDWPGCLVEVLELREAIMKLRHDQAL